MGAIFKVLKVEKNYFQHQPWGYLILGQKEKKKELIIIKKAQGFAALLNYPIQNSKCRREEKGIK